MDYLVIARKYRPQTFAEVAGQELVARTLANAIRSHRVAHAYLLAGPRGVGKTSMARILAKALCCEQGPTTEPCGVCEHCRRIADSTHPDVSEIDAARFGGVNDMREMLDGLHFLPSMARSKVIILDEVHQITKDGWNAMLKMLEEPPPHLHFIFATTDAEKVIPTVLSRCQRFEFRPLDLATIVTRLKDIAVREKAELSEPVLFRIARAAGGGMRDAQTLLDQLIAVSDGAARDADLDLLLGAARGEDLRDALDHLLAGRSAPAIEAVDRACAGGASPATVAEQLADHLRGVMLTQACGEGSPVVARLGLPPDDLARFAKAATPEKILRACQVLVGCQQQVRAGADPRLCLELACVRIARLGEMLDLERLLARIEKIESGAAPPGPR